jgi:DNA-directed RNA polymerase specialized sigma24 family protein
VSDVVKKTPGKPFFDETQVKALVVEYLRTKDGDIFADILNKIDGVIHAIIYERGIHRYEEMDELVQKIHIKIWRVLGKFDPSRGKLYSFITIVTHNTLGHINTELINRSAKLTPLECDGERSLLDTLPAKEDSSEMHEDVSVNIKKILTTCTLDKEIAAQRWLVRSFIDSHFSIRRHESANSMMKVFSISKERSRELYDQTLLEVRRQLLQYVKIPIVKVSQLRGTRQKPLASYFKTQGQDRFNKLVFLMGGVAPSANFNPNNLIDGSPFSKQLFE